MQKHLELYEITNKLTQLSIIEYNKYRNAI